MPPSKTRLLAAALAAVAVLLSAALCRADAPVETTDTTPIVSVFQRGDVIYASTGKGLYVASAKEKIWRKMEVPDSMPPGGTFAKQDPASPLLAYYQRWSDFPAKTSAALFISKDSGKTWQEVRIAPEHHFSEFYILPNGWLFACEQGPARSMTRLTTKFLRVANADTMPPAGRVFGSKDSGATWQDISANLSPDNYYFGLSQDPNHADQVRVMGVYSMKISMPRMYEYDAANGQWKINEADGPNAGIYSPVYKENGGLCFLTAGINGEFNENIAANLSNFFAYPYLQSGNGLLVSVVQVETEKSSYTFRAGEPKIIPVKAVFLQDHAPGKFLDNKDQTAFWGMATLPEGKKPDLFQSLTIPLGGSAYPDRERKIAAFMNDPDLQTVTLDYKHPYRRDIDLSKFHDFSQPGKYKIQIYHNDSGLVNWGATFCGQVIDITITP